jgi:hypothetical protein
VGRGPLLVRDRSLRRLTALVIAAALGATCRGIGRAPQTALRSFTCGSIACDAGSAYCETIKTDVPALPSNYSCRPLPASCRVSSEGPAPTCACFPAGTRCDFCSVGDVNGHLVFRRTCVGGH